MVDPLSQPSPPWGEGFCDNQSQWSESYYDSLSRIAECTPCTNIQPVPYHDAMSSIDGPSLGPTWRLRSSLLSGLSTRSSSSS